METSSSVFITFLIRAIGKECVLKSGSCCSTMKFDVKFQWSVSSLCKHRRTKRAYLESVGCSRTLEGFVVAPFDSWLEFVADLILQHSVCFEASIAHLYSCCFASVGGF